jgi:alpha-N-arabinofuranosidase
MPTFGSWEATVLEEAYDVVDYVSLHAYYEEFDGDPGSFLASAVDMDRFIDAVTATADHVRAKLRTSKRIDLSFDEWNVWYISRFQHDGPEPGWPIAPRLIEDRYSVTDAVVVGNLLISLLRHADRVAVACLAQLVNVIAPMMTEPGGKAWRQTTFYPFAATSRFARGDVLRVSIDAPTYETQRFGEVPVVDAVATRDDDGAVLFVVNRSLDTTVHLAVDTRPLGDQVGAVECLQLADADRHACNTAANPDRVRPHTVSLPPAGVDGAIDVPLPPVSWTMVRLTPGPT